MSVLGKQQVMLAREREGFSGFRDARMMSFRSTFEVRWMTRLRHDAYGDSPVRLSMPLLDQRLASPELILERDGDFVWLALAPLDVVMRVRERAWTDRDKVPRSELLDRLAVPSPVSRMIAANRHVA